MVSEDVTSDSTFSGTIDIKLTNPGIYTVRASDYEGGEFTQDNFVVSEVVDNDDEDAVVVEKKVPYQKPETIFF